MEDKRSKVRNLYLIRHGKVQLSDGVRRCIGRTDLPLSHVGILQSEDLEIYFRAHPVEKIYCSPLLRSRDTARYMAGGQYPIEVRENLTELYMGEWENVPMNQLKKTLESEPVHGEGREAGLKRFASEIRKILNETSGDVACVAHAGVNCCFLSSIQHSPLEQSRALYQPYGGISRIEIDTEGQMKIAELGVMPTKALNPFKCEKIWEIYHTPEDIREHCRKVCQRALMMGEVLNEAGCQLDLELLRSAALLHDVVRSRRNHAEEAARILRKEGYPEVADIVRMHHDLGVDTEQMDAVDNRPEMPTEAEVLYLADRLVCGTRYVTLDERFHESRKRCLEQNDSEEALKAHARRYQESKYIEQKVQYYIEKTL